MGKETGAEESRKWLLTINNPEENGYTREKVIDILDNFNLIYWCLGEEKGQEETPHIHIYIQSKSAKKFTTVKNKFPPAHIDHVRGTAEENRNYVFKEGQKYNKNPKTGEYEYRDSKGQIHKGIHDDSTNIERGEMPIERPGARNDLAELYDMIKNGYSTYEILEANPQFISSIDRIERVRQTLLEEKYKDTWRTLETTYIWGKTGKGKTRGVMDKYGYSNVYRVTDYQHPFDAYRGQDVIVFEEFRSSLRLDDMLKYLDGYPVEFPARYQNKTACFTKVYIISNIDIKKQYPNVQKEEPGSWDAFLRRIQMIHEYDDDGVHVMDLASYMAKDYVFKPIKNEEPPFDEDNPTDEQLSMFH